MFSLDVASMLDSPNLINIHMHNAQTHTTDNISRFYRLQLRKRAVVTFLKTTRHMSASVFSTREVCQGQSHAGRKGNVPLECFLYGFFSLSLQSLHNLYSPSNFLWCASDLNSSQKCNNLSFTEELLHHGIIYLELQGE